jgi:hypothetical protein
MQLPWDEHFHEIVMPAWQAYLRSETRLTEAASSGDDGSVKRAGYEALREGGAAIVYLHHFAEIVMRAQPAWARGKMRSLRDLRGWVSGHCTMLRNDNRPIADVELCGDVADALKHAILTQRLDVRQVRENDAVIALSTGYGELAFGEGKFGGVIQVIVIANTGVRALSSVCQNVVDAWRRVSGIALPPIGAA